MIQLFENVSTKRQGVKMTIGTIKYKSFLLKQRSSNR